jgi:isopenicillin-N epimerase
MVFDWHQVCESIEMDQSFIYLNTGTSGLVPKNVHARAFQLRVELFHNPTCAAWRAPWDELWHSRLRLSLRVGTTPDRLVFFTNVSQAINTFCLSANLPTDSEILLTDHEYGSMRMAWERAAKRRGWNLRVASLPLDQQDPDRYIDAITSQWTKQTRLLYVSHVLYSSGHVLPLKPIIQQAREAGILVFVDGAHAPGMIPLNLSELGAHFYAANLHKWFLAPVGAAFLYVEDGMEDHLEPWQVSWAYRDDRSQPNARNEFGSTPWIRQFEMEGTRDITPWRVIHLCCDFHDSIPETAKRNRFQELSQLVRESLDGVGGLRCITPETPQLRAGLTSFIVPLSIDGQRLRQRLWDRHRIEVNLVEVGNVNYFRVSTHVYNCEEEVDALARAIRSEIPKS